MALSVVWSVCVVIFAYAGCSSLMMLVVTDEPGCLVAKRSFLQMEVAYLFCSLIGDYLGWMMVDTYYLGTTEHALSSLGILSVSLLFFGLVDKCIPDDQWNVVVVEEETTIVKNNKSSADNESNDIDIDIDV